MMISNLILRFRMWLWSLRHDECEICGGTRGGVLGNENIVEGITMCDYCHANHMDYPRFWEDHP